MYLKPNYIMISSGPLLTSQKLFLPKLLTGIRLNSYDVARGKSASKDKMEKFIAKSKFLVALRKNPRFSHYFDRLSEAGAVSTVTSFFILHELTAIIPLFSVWYLLYNLNIMENIDFSNDLLTQCNEAIERMVGDKYNEFDKNRLVVSGAFSYAIVKLLGPIRIIVSLWGAPYLGKYLFVPFVKLKKWVKK